METMETGAAEARRRRRRATGCRSALHKKKRGYVDANRRAGVKSRWKSHAAIVLPQVLA